MAEIKKTVIDAETIKANSTPTRKRIKVTGFNGAFLDARFDDKGISEGPVSDNTLSQLRVLFPKAEIEEIKEPDEE
jgi:hypothetical protein